MSPCRIRLRLDGEGEGVIVSIEVINRPYHIINNSRNENLVSFRFFSGYPKRNEGQLFLVIPRNEKKRVRLISGYPETSRNCPKIDERKSRFHYLWYKALKLLWVFSLYLLCKVERTLIKN